MRVAAIAASLSARVPWRVAQKILAVNDIARGQGWDKTLEKLEGIRDDSNVEEALARALIEHYSCGEKLVRFYKVSRNNITAINTLLGTKKVPKSNFRTRYPLMLDADELKSEPKKPTLVDISYDDNAKGTRLTFAAARVIKAKSVIVWGTRISSMSGRECFTTSAYNS
ncbi:hypothetical protein [Methylocystis hirsuta]|uniref:hypothetical protein n=1 Tax=Methylocystis hirsuta TaxID=369798 RepID=UPI0011CDC064|nr:hypothetical protein [Methylocystis hirsuta]